MTEYHAATWRDLYAHLKATGDPMTVRGRVAPDAPELDWIATTAGLNRYSDDGANTATWYPDARDALTTPVPIQAASDRTETITEAHAQRRAAQIAAVREVMGWDVTPEDPYEENIAGLAAEIVDAVMAVAEDAAEQGTPARRHVVSYPSGRLRP